MEGAEKDIGLQRGGGDERREGSGQEVLLWVASIEAPRERQSQPPLPAHEAFRNPLRSSECTV